MIQSTLRIDQDHSHERPFSRKIPVILQLGLYRILHSKTRLEPDLAGFVLSNVAGYHLPATQLCSNLMPMHPSPLPDNMLNLPASSHREHDFPAIRFASLF
jgi:hypothetical protein